MPINRRTRSALMSPQAPAAPRKVVTIREVAEAAGVSVATVSNVINGRVGAVGAKTRKLVEKQIERFGYRPQASGRGLRNARYNAVAILIIDDAQSYLSDPFVGNVVAGLTQTLNDNGFLAVLHGSPRRDIEDAIVVRQFGVDGFCVVPSGLASERRALIDRLVTLRQPLVLIQETEPMPTGDLCVVRQDDFSGGVQLAEHLLARGCRNLAMVVPKLEWPALQARLNGLRHGASHGKPRGEVHLVHCDTEAFPDVVRAVTEYLDRGGVPDAIVGGNDQIAIAALQTVLRRGMKVPRDIRITGFNAFAFWQYTTPTITTVVSVARELGVRAANAMILRLESGVFSTPETVIPLNLQPGEST
jgi:LacI family transcriptional regulator